MEIIATMIANLQRELMELHQQTIDNADQTYDWMIRIRINLPKCPKQIEVLEMVNIKFAMKTGHWVRSSPTKTA